MPTLQKFSALGQRARSPVADAVQPKIAGSTSPAEALGRIYERLGVESAERSNEFGWGGVEDGLGDAFRHTYSFAKVAAIFGEAGAQLIGLLHEVIEYGPQGRASSFEHSTLASMMDISNNAVGAGLEAFARGGQDDMLAVRIYFAVASGQLKIVERREHDGDVSYNLRDTDYRDVGGFLWDKVEPEEWDKPKQEMPCMGDDEDMIA